MSPAILGRDAERCEGMGVPGVGWVPLRWDGCPWGVMGAPGVGWVPLRWDGCPCGGMGVPGVGWVPLE